MAIIQDSGKRREFETGAVRDIAEGKGRCDLLPLDIISSIYGDKILSLIYGFILTGETEFLRNVITQFSADIFVSPHQAILELAKHYEDGCRKYGERNWEKGILLHCFIDSAIRHYLKFLDGQTDERHDRAVLWNLYGALWTLQHHPEMNDLPFARTEKE